MSLLQPIMQLSHEILDDRLEKHKKENNLVNKLLRSIKDKNNIDSAKEDKKIYW